MRVTLTRTRGEGGAAAVDSLMAQERAKWVDYVRIAKIEPQ